MIFLAKLAKIKGSIDHDNTRLLMTTATPALSKDLELPHNILIEQALLSALMTVEDSYDKISDLLVAEDFYGERHKHIFACIQFLAGASQPYDSLSVFESLSRQDLLGAVGGENYLMQIEQSVGTAFNLENYAQKIKELSIYRKLIASANQILQLAYHPKTRPLSEIVDIAESQIFAINESLNKREGKQGVKDGRMVVQEVVNYLNQLQARGNELIGLDTSFDGLNNKIKGLQKGHLIILAARPGMGKTTFALNLAQSVLQQNLPVVFFSMEMDATSIIIRLLSAWGAIDHGHLQTAQMSPEEWAKFNNGVMHLMHSQLYIDDRNDLPPSEIRSVCRKIAKNHDSGLGLIVVDYLQLMKVPGKEGNRVLEIGEISRSLKALAREMDCPVIALSQLSRDVEKRPDRRPIPSDLRESGAIEQDADVIMFIYRDEVYNDKNTKSKGLAEIIVGKNRHGPRGTVMLNFEGRFSRFGNLMHPIPEGYDETTE